MKYRSQMKSLTLWRCFEFNLRYKKSTILNNMSRQTFLLRLQPSQKPGCHFPDKSEASWGSVSTHITTCSANSNYSMIPFSPLQFCPSQAHYKHPLRRFSIASVYSMYSLYCNEKGRPRRSQQELEQSRYSESWSPQGRAIHISTQSEMHTGKWWEKEWHVILQKWKAVLQMERFSVLIMCSKLWEVFIY